MSKTNIKYLIQAWIMAHRAVLEGAAMSITLAVIMSAGYSTPYQGHFLQRHPTVQQLDKKQTPLHEERVQNRLRKRVIRSQQIVDLQEPILQKEAPTPPPSRPMAVVTEPVRPAARTEAIRTEVIAPPETPAVEEITPVAEPEVAAFPSMGRALHPVGRIPNWGVMTSSTQWGRPYAEMSTDEYVSVPSYNLSVLMKPLEELKKTRSEPETIKILTAKLYYSTRHFGAYDIDAGEFSSIHPGIDLKLPQGTPFGSIAGGRVHDVRNDTDLGLHVLIEHRTSDGKTFYSIYGHMHASSVKKGQDIEAGQMIGTVGTSGQTTGAHIHLQVDAGIPDEQYHEIYWPQSMPSRAEADRHTINPILFIGQFAAGE